MVMLQGQTECRKREVDMLSSSYHRVSKSEPYTAMNKVTAAVTANLGIGNIG